MDKRKFAGFDAKTDTLGEPELRSGQAGDAATSRRGGRPPRDRSNGFVQAQILKIYVSHLRSSAPQAWSERQLNFELFSRKTRQETLSPKKTPFNGIRALEVRKTIPRLDRQEVLAAGILRAESTPRFSGGLQILYHPYQLILTGPRNLEELRELMALCKCAAELRIFRYSPFGAVRTLQATHDEISAIDLIVQSMRGSPPILLRGFLDVLSVSFGLALEASMIGDHDRFIVWRNWFSSRGLRFEEWSRGEVAPRQALDRWIDFTLAQLAPQRISLYQSGLNYLQRQVLNSQDIYIPADACELTALQKSSMNAPEMAWTFLSILAGEPPTDDETAKLVSKVVGVSHRDFDKELKSSHL